MVQLSVSRRGIKFYQYEPFSSMAPAAIMAALASNPFFGASAWLMENAETTRTNHFQMIIN